MTDPVLTQKQISHLSSGQFIACAYTYRSHEIWHDQNKQSNVSQDEEEPNEGYHVGREP